MRRGKILVVDDEVEVAQLLADYLTDQGYQVVTAHSGIEALAKLDLEKPQVIVLDVRMPEMDGVEVLRRIRTVNTRVGILMVSGNDEVELAKQTIVMGAYDYTLKPLDFDYLLRAVDKMMAVAVTPTVSSEEPLASIVPSSHALLYDLALEIFRTTRAFSPVARQPLGAALEETALGAVQRGAGSDRPEVIRALNRIRTLLRFAKDLGDITDDVHRGLEAHIAKVRRSLGMS